MCSLQGQSCGISETVQNSPLNNYRTVLGVLEHGHRKRGVPPDWGGHRGRGLEAQRARVGATAYSAIRALAPESPVPPIRLYALSVV